MAKFQGCAPASHEISTTSRWIDHQMAFSDVSDLLLHEPHREARQEDIGEEYPVGPSEAGIDRIQRAVVAREEVVVVLVRTQPDRVSLHEFLELIALPRDQAIDHLAMEGRPGWILTTDFYTSRFIPSQEEIVKCTNCLYRLLRVEEFTHFLQYRGKIRGRDPKTST